MPEYHELIQALDRYRLTIDADIKANGGAEKAKGQLVGAKKGKGKGRGGQKQSGQNAQSTADGQTATAYFTGQAGKAGQASGKWLVNTNGGQHSTQNKSNVKGGKMRGKGGNKGQGGQQTGQNAKAAPSLSYCSMCGSVEHTAADGCDRMRNNAGQVIKAFPTQTTCSLCPTVVSPRLQHPESLCPWRKGGCLSMGN